jgi:hypothetical protein
MVDKPTLAGCWPWLGGCNDYGYGVFEIPNFGQVYAHKLVYAFQTGSLNSLVIVRHSCDNPPCCNPWHLIGGTKRDNAKDCIARGRFGPRRTGKQKISPAVAAAIVAAASTGENRRALADRFGVHVCQIYRASQKEKLL